MSTDEPVQSVQGWLRTKRRRNGPNIRDVYPHRHAKNTVCLAGWRWARAAQVSQIATDRLALSSARLAAVDAEIEAMVEKIVRRELLLAGIKAKAPASKKKPRKN